MSKGRQTETEERAGDCDDLSQSRSKLLFEWPPILDMISLTIDNGELKDIPHRILTFHWLL
jgi:hypothetical protein